ncbi:ClpX, ATPase regulatory subunit [Choiromyces venosus 120613-1]|uniref:ClpX, ATPase regulatory subunit n=1 Tax=Choiromyces venosus 120613-1 TaxID=1336337 RepID=A0A3N4K269_9PEZI|nr:ClpX, ATPase regulatory subunit [Choiromyces venosus 120613-1]
MILGRPPLLYRGIRPSSLTVVRRWMSSYDPSDFQFGGAGFSSRVDTDTPTFGPLGDAPSGLNRLTPRALKQHLDRFVVGQNRSKRILSTAIYHHYKRTQQLQQRQEEQDELLRSSQAVGAQTLDEEFPHQPRTVHVPPKGDRSSIHDFTPLTIEKSNVLCLGPTGVGKTLMLRTLARVLEVPFSMSDCTPLTQAGYVGEDADVCIHRLLAAANWDIRRAESGIVCLDEFDKIAKPKSPNGSKDISGEGVQQALLKIIEGTTLQINTKPERRPPAGLPNSPNGSNSSFGAGMAGGGAAKGETFTIDTSNILFIFTGAFIGMQKHIIDRVAKGSIGFNAHVRGSSVDELAEDQELMKELTPFFSSSVEEADEADDESGTKARIKKRKFNPLELTEPSDLISFGLIPEIVGRIPIIAAVESLDEEMLVRVLTEPRNALLKQYTELFALSGVELRFTSPALRQIAKSAIAMNTGARGLRTVMERILSDAMFDSPGSSIRHVLVTEAVSKRECPPIYFARGQQHVFHSMIATEEEEWAVKTEGKKNSTTGTSGTTLGSGSGRGQPGRKRVAGFT